MAVLAKKNIKPAERQKLERDERYHGEQIAWLYTKLLQHEKPKLKSVEAKADPTGPVYHEVDLDRLSREDLLALARILPKLGAAQSEERK
jgi:hypothetical protein